MSLESGKRLTPSAPIQPMELMLNKNRKEITILRIVLAFAVIGYFFQNQSCRRRGHACLPPVTGSHDAGKVLKWPISPSDFDHRSDKSADHPIEKPIRFNIESQK